jgi:hypothetical protein
MTDYDDEARSVFGDPDDLERRFRRLDRLDELDEKAAETARLIEAAGGNPIAATLTELVGAVAALARQIERVEARVAELEARDR